MAAEALGAIARKAIDRETGARGLRSHHGGHTSSTRCRPTRPRGRQGGRDLLTRSWTAPLDRCTCTAVVCGQAESRIHRKRREDTVAKGQLRSNREKKKPKAEKRQERPDPVGI